jgi:hypothetical protein
MSTAATYLAAAIAAAVATAAEVATSAAAAAGASAYALLIQPSVGTAAVFSSNDRACVFLATTDVDSSVVPPALGPA